MRLSYLAVALVVGGGVAHADKKVTEMQPGFVKEAGGCNAQRNGLTKVVTSGKTLAGVETEVATLETELTAVTSWCDEVNGMVDFLKANPDTPYKKIERELDDRDNKIRKLRREAKKQTDANETVTRKVIKAIAAAPKGSATTTAGGNTVEPKPTPAKFPSRRTIDLPPLQGTWKMSGTAVTDTVEYGDPDGSTVSITARTFTGATCDQQKKSMNKRAMTIDDLAIAADGQGLGIAWSGRGRTHDKLPHLLSEMCVPAKTGSGGLIVISDVVPADNTKLADQLQVVMTAMIAAQLAPAP